jgi:hypothetical protein
VLHGLLLSRRKIHSEIIAASWAVESLSYFQIEVSSSPFSVGAGGGDQTGKDGEGG